MKKVFGLLMAVVMVLGFCASSYAIPSASINYSTSFNGTDYTYFLTVNNTSSPEYDIYYIIFGFQTGVPYTVTIPNTTPLSSPPLWSAQFPTLGNAGWYTNWAGSSVASGYILAGTSLSGFSFTSPTAPPAIIPFSVGFYNNVNAWGFAYNGTATAVPEPSTLLLLGSGLAGLAVLRNRFKG